MDVIYLGVHGIWCPPTTCQGFPIEIQFHVFQTRTRRANQILGALGVGPELPWAPQPSMAPAEPTNLTIMVTYLPGTPKLDTLQWSTSGAFILGLCQRTWNQIPTTRSHPWPAVRKAASELCPRKARRHKWQGWQECRLVSSTVLNSDWKHLPVRFALGWRWLKAPCNKATEGSLLGSLQTQVLLLRRCLLLVTNPLPALRDPFPQHRTLVDLVCFRAGCPRSFRFSPGLHSGELAQHNPNTQITGFRLKC